MKKIILCLISIVFINACVTQKAQKSDPAFTYKNENVGLAIIMPDNWKLYTNKETAHKTFQAYFKENKSPDESPLFLGLLETEEAGVRCLIEKTNTDIHKYFRKLYKKSKNEGALALSVQQNKTGDTIAWTFSTKAGIQDFTYIETLTRHNGYVYRLGFWTYTNLFKQYLPNFRNITEQVYFFDGENQTWRPLWKGLQENLESDILDSMTIEETPVKEGPSRAIFFEVKGKTNTVYLLGSLEFGHPDLYPLVNVIEKAFVQSNYIVIQVNTNDPAAKKKSQEFLITHGNLPDGKTIDEYISPELYSKLKTRIESLDFSINDFNKFEPLLAGTILKAMQIVSAGYETDSIVEKYFLGRAENKKSIIELETIDQYIDTLKSIDGEQYLEYMLFLFDFMDEYINDTVDAWMTGDVKKLEDMIFNDYMNITSENDQLFEKLFFQENTVFVKKIEEFLSKDKDYFVIINAGYLVGKKSVVDLLTKRGYTVLQK